MWRGFEHAGYPEVQAQGYHALLTVRQAGSPRGDVGHARGDLRSFDALGDPHAEALAVFRGDANLGEA